MKFLFSRLEWFALLIVFKTKRLINSLFAERMLDYPGASLSITTTTLREYTVRARSVGKEPETVQWIERFAKNGLVLYDIGANVGAYSLIAAARGMSVIAFEPMAQNFHALSENITLNGLEDKISALPFVLGDTTKLVSFFVADSTRGSSAGFFSGQAEGGNQRTMAVLTLDESVRLFKLPLPTLLKIDVDGAEPQLFQGALDTLTKSSLKGVLVEVGPSTRDTIQKLLTAKGFMLVGEYPRTTSFTNLIFDRR